MKIFSVKNGNNAMIACGSLGRSSASGVCKSIDVVSDTDGTVTIARKVDGIDSVSIPVATVTVANNHGQALNLNVPICAGDTVVVDGTPTSGSAKYCIRLICD